MRALQLLGPSTGGIRMHVAALADGLERLGVVAPVLGPAGVLDGRFGCATPDEAVAQLRAMIGIARDDAGQHHWRRTLHGQCAHRFDAIHPRHHHVHDEHIGA